MNALPVQAFDEYGFPLDLTPQQAKARQECIAAQRKQEEKWLKYAKAGQLPAMEKLKKLCRKVGHHSAKGCCWRSSGRLCTVRRLSSQGEAETALQEGVA